MPEPPMPEPVPVPLVVPSPPVLSVPLVPVPEPLSMPVPGVPVPVLLPVPEPFIWPESWVCVPGERWSFISVAASASGALAPRHSASIKVCGFIIFMVYLRFYVEHNLFGPDYWLMCDGIDERTLRERGG